MDKKKMMSSISVIAAGILWGSMGIFVKRLNAENLTSLDIVALRAIVTSIVMFAILFFFKREWLKIKLKDIWCFIGTGIGSIVFFNYCYFRTMVTASLSIAAILLYTAPAMVMVMSFVLFKEKLTIHKIVAVLLAFAGCVCVSGLSSDEKLSISCLLTGLGAGLGYALYSIFSRFAIQRGYSSFTISAYTFLFAAIGAIPLAQPENIFAVTTASCEVMLFALVFGIVTTVAPYALYTWGLKYMENGRASILASVEPVVAAIIGVVVFKENMSISTAIGILLILTSIVLCNKEEQK